MYICIFAWDCMVASCTCTRDFLHTPSGKDSMETLHCYNIHPTHIFLSSLVGFVCVLGPDVFINLSCDVDRVVSQSNKQMYWKVFMFAMEGM